MNQYNNEVGYHSPELSKKHKEMIDKVLGRETLDVSWHNDVCDSIDLVEDDSDNSNDELYLPNAEVTNEDEEDFSTFYHSNSGTSFSNIEEVLIWLKNRYKL